MVVERSAYWLAALCVSVLWSTTGFAQLGGGDTSVGYIDSAVVQNQVRFRFDASFDNPTPDRAEFFYPQCGCFPGGPGPLGQPVSRVDYQEISLFAESLIFGDMVSGFVELPFRFIDPQGKANSEGVSDLNIGIKAALLANRCQRLTFQFRTYLPTGEGRKGLGTEHVSLEPALLCMRRFDGGTLEAEIRDWIPIDGTDAFAGNVLRYGVGVSLDCYDDGCLSIKPVLETVAWSVLSGDFLDRSNPPSLRSSAETTIVNIKIGARFNFAPRCCGDGTKSLYVGYGKALTNDRWYDDTIRAEYRLLF